MDLTGGSPSLPVGTHYIPEQIIGKLRKVALEIAKGLTASQIAKNIVFTVPMYYRWRKQDGELHTDQAQRLDAAEEENAC